MGKLDKQLLITKPNSSAEFLPGSVCRIQSLSCLPSFSMFADKSDKLILFFLAKASAALVGAPAPSKATLAGGPHATMSESGVRSSNPLMYIAKRLGAA